MDISTFKKRLFENLDNSTDIETKEYVVNVFKNLFTRYLETFSNKLDLDRTGIYHKFTNDILSGFPDFMINAEHVFGCSAIPSITGFPTVKHGCWLNSLNFVTKYWDYYKNSDTSIKLCFGFIVHKDDLEDVEKDLAKGLCPVGVKLIPHGFIVLNKEGENLVFDPTLGQNKEYHYFFKEVPEEIWKSFRYYYNSPSDWEVKDFAEWTNSKIREDLESGVFLEEIGEFASDFVEPEDTEELDSVEQSEDNNEASLETNDSETVDNSSEEDSMEDSEEPVNFENELNSDDIEANINAVNFEFDNNASNNVLESVNESSKDGIDLDSLCDNVVRGLEILFSKNSILAVKCLEAIKSSDISTKDTIEAYSYLTRKVEGQEFPTDISAEDLQYIKNKISKIYENIPEDVKKETQNISEQDPKTSENLVWSANDDTELSGLKNIKLDPNLYSEDNLEFQKAIKTQVIPIQFGSRYGLYSEVYERVVGNKLERDADAMSSYNGYILNVVGKPTRLKDTEGDMRTIYSSFVVPSALNVFIKSWTPKDLTRFLVPTEKISAGEVPSNGETNDKIFTKYYEPSTKEYKEFTPEVINNYNLDGLSLITIRLEKGKKLKPEIFGNEYNDLYIENFNGVYLYNYYVKGTDAEEIAKKYKMEIIYEMNLPSQVTVVQNNNGYELVDIKVGKVPFFNKDHKYTVEGNNNEIYIRRSKNGEDYSKILNNLISSLTDEGKNLYILDNHTLFISSEEKSEIPYHKVLDKSKFNKTINEVNLKEALKNIEIKETPIEPLWNDGELGDDADPLRNLYVPKKAKSILISNVELPVDEVYSKFVNLESNFYFKKDSQINTYYLYTCSLGEEKEIQKLFENKCVKFSYATHSKTGMIHRYSLSTNFSQHEYEDPESVKKRKDQIQPLDVWGNRVYKEIEPYSITFSDSRVSESDVQKTLEDLLLKVKDHIKVYAEKVNAQCLEYVRDGRTDEYDGVPAIINGWEPGIAFGKLLSFGKEYAISLNSFPSIISLSIQNTLENSDTNAGKYLAGLVKEILDNLEDRTVNTLESTFLRDSGVVVRFGLRNKKDDTGTIIEGGEYFNLYDGSLLNPSEIKSSFYFKVLEDVGNYKKGEVYFYNTNAKIEDQNGKIETTTQIELKNESDIDKKEMEKVGRGIRFTGSGFEYKYYHRKNKEWLSQNTDSEQEKKINIEIYGRSHYVLEDFEYDGKSYEKGDIVVPSLRGYETVIEKFDKDYLADRIGDYKRIADSYKKGENATQLDIMNVMFYCRKIGLFRSESLKNDYKDDLGLIDGYKIEGKIAQREPGLKLIFGIDDLLDNENQSRVKLVLETLNKYFINQAAILATDTEESFKYNANMLSKIQSNFRDMVGEIEKEKDKANENDKKLTFSKVKNVLGKYQDIIDNLKMYLNMFNVGTLKGRKDFDEKVLLLGEGNNYNYDQEIIDLMLKGVREETQSLVYGLFSFLKSELSGEEKNIDDTLATIILPYRYIDINKIKETDLRSGLNSIAGSDPEGFGWLLGKQDYNKESKQNCINFLKSNGLESAEQSDLDYKVLDIIGKYYFRKSEEDRENEKGKHSNKRYSDDSKDKQKIIDGIYHKELQLSPGQRIIYEGGIRFRDQIYNYIDIIGDKNTVEHYKDEFRKFSEEGLLDFLCTQVGDEYEFMSWNLLRRISEGKENDGELRVKYGKNPLVAFLGQFGITTNEEDRDLKNNKTFMAALELLIDIFSNMEGESKTRFDKMVEEHSLGVSIEGMEEALKKMSNYFENLEVPKS